MMGAADLVKFETGGNRVEGHLPDEADEQGENEVPLIDYSDHLVDRCARSKCWVLRIYEFDMSEP